MHYRGRLAAAVMRRFPVEAAANDDVGCGCRTFGRPAHRRERVEAILDRAGAAIRGLDEHEIPAPVPQGTSDSRPATAEDDISSLSVGVVLEKKGLAPFHCGGGRIVIAVRRKLRQLFRPICLRAI